MNKNRSFVLKLIAGVILALIIVGLNEKFQLVQCNTRRNYKTMEDRTIQDIKDRIASLEKEQIKDVMTSKRLSEQYSLLGRLFLDRKLWEQGIDCFLNAEKYGNSAPSVYYALGLGYANRGFDRGGDSDFIKAEECYRKAIEKNPGYEDAMYGLGVLLYYHRDNKVEGLKLVTEVAMKNSANYNARFAMARMNYENNDPGRALQIYQQLQQDLDKLPDSEDANNYRRQCSENIARINAEISSR